MTKAPLLKCHILALELSDDFRHPGERDALISLQVTHLKLRWWCVCVCVCTTVFEQPYDCMHVFIFTHAALSSVCKRACVFLPRHMIYSADTNMMYLSFSIRNEFT